MTEPPEPSFRPSRSGIKRARRARRRRRRVGVVLMLVGLTVAAVGVGLYLDDRSGGEVVPDVRSDTLERTTTTPPLTTLAPATTVPEPTVP